MRSNFVKDRGPEAPLKPTGSLQAHEAPLLT